jgi:hypothetical protein
MDDFIAYLQAQSALDVLYVSRALLHAIHAIQAISPPPDLTGITIEDPINHKNLLVPRKWANTKEKLAWFNAKDQTLSIPNITATFIRNTLTTIEHA